MEAANLPGTIILRLTTPKQRAFFICPLCNWSIFLSPFYTRLLGFGYRGDMTKIDTTSPSLTSAPASLSEFEPARRLIVLVPDMESDYMPAIHRIWELANAWHACVLLLSLCKDTKQELSFRRGLITMCAMLQDGHVLAEVKIEMGTNWVDLVNRNYQTGDLIVCFAEQRAGLLHKPLSQILQSNLNIPIYIISGRHLPKPKSKLLSQTMAWAGFLGIMIGFFLLQINIVQVSKGGLQSILLILSIIPEFWLIWVLNSWLQ